MLVPEDSASRTLATLLYRISRERSVLPEEDDDPAQWTQRRQNRAVARGKKLIL
jgi:hypothetical protein